MFRKVFRIDHRRIDIGKYLEMVRAADIITITGSTVGNKSLISGIDSYLVWLKWLNHAFFSFLAYPLIRFNAQLAHSKIRD